MKIYLTENKLVSLVETTASIIDTIMNYLKRFGQKGKLPPFEGRLYDAYKNYLKPAYEWAEESTEGVQREGLPYFTHQFRNYVANNFTINKRGLIYVERSIDLDPSRGLDNLEFKSVGECWSWKRHNANSYCADFSLLNNNVQHVVLCGYVHPNSIDWKETIYLNSYGMKNETEIRMNDNAYVEVSYIKVNGMKYNLGTSFLLNASADKYNQNKNNW